MSRPDLGSLLNVLLPFAREMLAKHGEFFPFAAAMSRIPLATLATVWETGIVGLHSTKGIRARTEDAVRSQVKSFVQSLQGAAKKVAEADPRGTPL
jgi:hypothetical protein